MLLGPVAAIMTESVETVEEQGLVDDLMKTMTERRIRHVPVVTNGQLSGIISIGDIVKARMMQQEQEVDSLKAYVAGAA